MWASKWKFKYKGVKLEPNKIILLENFARKFQTTIQIQLKLVLFIRSPESLSLKHFYDKRNLNCKIVSLWSFWRGSDPWARSIWLWSEIIKWKVLIFRKNAFCIFSYLRCYDVNESLYQNVKFIDTGSGVQTLWRGQNGYKVKMYS